MAGIPWLLCTEEILHIAREYVMDAGTALDRGFSHNQEVQVLRPNELLYLVLIYLDNAMASAVVNGLGSIHALRFDTECSDETKDCVSAYFELYLDKFDVNSDEVPDELSLHDAIQFNDFMQLRTNAEIDCSANKEINFEAETNLQQPKFRQCLEKLQENIGWQVPAQDTLQLQVHANVFMQGFYPTFTEYNEEDRNYLTELSSRKWTTARYSLNQMRICHFNSETFGANDAPIVMNPFWAEFFDVANEHDSISEPSLGCDMDPSSADLNLFTYNTKC